MSINFASFSPVVGTVITVGGLLFSVGIQAEKLGSLGVKVNAMEMKEEKKNDMLCEIHGKIKSIDERLNYIESEMKEIKYHLFKKN